jgi:hypothetical protein
MFNLMRRLGLSMILIVGVVPLTAHAGLTLTAAGVNQGLGLTTFASGFPTFNSTGGVIGPLGIAFPTSGGVLVTDALGNVRLFPTDNNNQNAISAPVGQNYGNFNASGLAQVGGNIYMAQQANGNLIQINNNGTFNQTILTGINPVGLVANPTNGHLFGGGNGNNEVFDIDPIAKTKTLFVNATPDGLAISSDGRVLYLAITGGSLAGHILGFDTTTKSQVFDSGFIPGGIDGTTVGTGSFSNYVFANTNSGTLVEVNLSTHVQTTIASGGSRGDFVTVDPSTNTLLITQSDSILRLTGASFIAVPEPASIVMTVTAAFVGLSIAWCRTGVQRDIANSQR